VQLRNEGVKQGAAILKHGEAFDEMTLTEAWRLWAQGHLTEDTVLWGLRLLWWARIGKLLQCAGGATIVAEIIGPDRLRVFGNSLHGRFTLASAGKYMRDGLLWYRAMFKYAFLTKGGSPEEKEALAKTSEYYADKINFIVSFPVMGLIWYLYHNRFSWLAQIIGGLFIYCVVFVTLSPVATVLLIVTVLSLGVVFDSLIIEPIAWLLERPALDRWTKIVALLLLLAGFHFDFLTS
jgi:hypothetical protein